MSPRAHKARFLTALAVLALASVRLQAAEPKPGAPAASGGRLELYQVPLPIRSYRLFDMSMDADGCIWFGSIHHAIHHYDPRTGTAETVPLPSKAVASACLCAGDKVYVLGQAYPRLILYDRKARQFREAAYPSARPNVWYGAGPLDGRHLYLFDQGSGVIEWDTQTDTGKILAYPYRTPLPGGGRYVAADNALWCFVWDYTGGVYKPLGIARLDLGTKAFTGWYPYPAADDGLRPYTDPEATLFLSATLKGKLMPFDFKEKRWCRFLAIPRFGELFGFQGGPFPHRGHSYYSLSTYNGTPVGCDGKPPHFCNAILEFDAHTGRFDFLTLDEKDSYHQLSYLLSAGGELYVTGTNIREPDGRLNGGRQGEVLVWQTRRPKKK
jgi:streptogramin lyase